MDIARLKELISLMDRNQLAELEMEGDGIRIRLRKKEDPVREVLQIPGMGAGALAAGGAGAQPAVTNGPASAAAEAAEAIPEENLIRAPMVGTFYRSPSPESESFVDVGDSIDEGATLCIIEAMKVMNEVKVERGCTIEAILVDNGEPVEYGTPLFRIR